MFTPPDAIACEIGRPPGAKVASGPSASMESNAAAAPVEFHRLMIWEIRDCGAPKLFAARFNVIVDPLTEMESGCDAEGTGMSNVTPPEVPLIHSRPVVAPPEPVVTEKLPPVALV